MFGCRWQSGGDCFWLCLVVGGSQEVIVFGSVGCRWQSGGDCVWLFLVVGGSQEVIVFGCVWL